MAGNRKRTPQYRANRAALLEGNPDCYWGCGNKATQADHLLEHDAGGDDSMSNLREFLKLKKEFPNVLFEAFFANPDGSVRTIK